MTLMQKKIVAITHPEKVVFPKSNITKGDIIAYYQHIAPFMLPYIKDHCIVMRRYPEGIKKEGFFQKQVPDYFPRFIKRKTIDLKSGPQQTLIHIDSIHALTYIANQNTIELHRWLSSIKNPLKPDLAIFDLDPATIGKSTKQLLLLYDAAHELREALTKQDLIAFIMTTGSRGYHIVVPLKATKSFTCVHEWAKNMCAELADQYPTKFTIELAKEKRKGRVFLDYLRNTYGQTGIAPYSLRAQEYGPVAAPLEWSELEHTVPWHYTMHTIFKRLEKNSNPWKDFYTSKKAIAC